jgi:hypothetical protein
LAYIKTGLPDLDAQTEQGLYNLAQMLKARTAAEPKAVAGVDPEVDELSFFPILYWAIDRNNKTLSKTALEKIQFYIDHGGTLLIDTRDGETQNNADALKAALQNLNIQPLMEMPNTHVLTQSFYLLKKFPGRYTTGTLWIETYNSGRDGVSSVILGSNDWAASWSDLNIKTFGHNAVAIGTSPSQEQSIRAGINFILYALTGNYKSDQVHIPAILERLGQQ